MTFLNHSTRVVAVSRVAVLLVIALLTLRCESNDTPLQTPPELQSTAFSEALGGYLSGFTAGEISRRNPVVIQFADNIVPQQQVGKSIDNATALTFEPKISGEAKWRDRRTLVFTPEKPLATGQTFKGMLILSHFFEEVPEDIGQFDFQFWTPARQFEIETGVLKSAGNNSMENQVFEGQIRSADFEASVDIKSIVRIRHQNNDLDLRWEHSDDGRLHTFVVDNIQRQVQSSELIVVWDGGDMEAVFKGEERITVPPLQSFTFVRTEAVLAPERKILIHFSDPLNTNQNLDGLIQVANHEVRFTIDGNRVSVHPGSTTHTFSGNVTVRIEPGIRNVAGAKITDRQESSLEFKEIKPAVQLTGSGVIMPTSEHLPFSFKSVNLKSVDVRVVKIFEKNVYQFFQVNTHGGSNELYRVGKLVKEAKVDLDDTDQNNKQWTTYAVDLNNLIEPDPGAIYQVSVGFKPSYILYPCAITTEDTATPMPLLAEADEASGWDGIESYFNDFEGPIDKSNPCNPGYYHAGQTVTRNVLASDLGLVAKRGGDGRLHVFVNDLHTTEPLGNVDLAVYDLSQEQIAYETSNGEGKASFELSAQPFLLVATRGAQRGYLKLQDGQSLSISRFDVGGAQVQQGLRGYIYGERGVRRPGDDIYLTFILNDDMGSLPSDHPVVFELRDPRGQRVDHIVQTESVNNFYTFQTKTQEDAPTGTYAATVTVGGATFSQAVKVEAIMPNRMKININFDEDYLTAEKAKNEASMDVTWLHGAVARNLKANVQATLKQSKTRFGQFEDFVFDDPSRPYTSHTQTIFDQTVDDNGHATFAVDLTANDQAPGMLGVDLTTKVFEPGGAFSIDQFSIPYHPYSNYVGLQLPPGDKRRGMLLTDKDHEVELVTVDAAGNPVARDNLILDVYEVEWRWWWDQANDQVTNYNAKRLTHSISRDTVSTDANGQGKAIFQVKYPEWGRYLVRVCDPGGHCSGKIVYIDWPGWAGKPKDKQPGGESMLTFSADKESYNVGETVTLSMPTPALGRALVSLESGSKMLDSYWVEAEKGTTTFSFEATPEMAPNIYASVTLLQPHAQTSNDLPVRLYGVIPIPVYDAETRIQPVINMADELRPEASTTVKISEADGRPMTYTLAVVDEGLLDLTRFRTPNPWDYFFARQALTTKTWDLYDEVLGASSMEYQALLSIGGGDEGEEETDGTSKVNRFKPVVKYLGPFALKPDEIRSHEIEMPLYLGSVRTMVVAGQDGAYGAAEKATPVRKPLMLLGTLPRVLGPEEEVDFYLSVFAMNDDVGQVEVEVTTSDLLSSVGEAKKTVAFTRAGEEVVAFPLRVAAATGTATVKAVARSGNERAEYTFDIDVRHPNPPELVMVDTLLAAGDTWTYEPELFGIAGTNSGSIEVTSLPPINLGKRLDYLIRYPHGCIEQTTSAVFPQLFLPALMELPDSRKVRIESNVKMGISRLTRFQHMSGGLSYWPGSGHVSEWGTNYAGHFMLEAQKLGYTISEEFLKDWTAYQQKQANNWVHNNRRRSSTLIQAHRLYLLALAGKPQMGAMNRYREGQYGSVVDKWLLATAYHLAGQPEVSRSLTQSLGWQIRDYKELSDSFGTSLRDKSIVLHALTTMQRNDEAFPLVMEISDALNSGKWMSTQTTAYSLLSMLGYAMLQDADLDLSYQFAGASRQVLKSEKSFHQIDLGLEDDTSQSISLTNNMDLPLHIKAVVRGAPPVGQETDASSRLDLEIVYKDMQGTEISPDRLTQGTDFYAEVTVKNPNPGQALQELALSQIFPSGWQIHNVREADASNKEYAIPTYQDIRDDRVFTYFDMGSTRRRSSEVKKTFRVLLNASYRGRFYLPAVSVEAMYDADIHARRKGMWVEVVDAL